MSAPSSGSALGVIGLRLVILAPFSMAVHGYLAWRLLSVLPEGVLAWAVALAFGLSSIGVAGTYALVPLTRKPGIQPLQDICYVLMGYVALMGLSMVARDLCLALLAWLAPPALVTWLGPLSVWLVIGCTLVLGTLAVFGARQPAEVREVVIPCKGLHPALDGLRIAQVSDLHVGPTVHADRVEQVADQVAALEPDLIAMTGDLVDAPVARIAHELEPLIRLGSRHGTYFVTGNHEYYVDGEAWCQHLAGAGWHVLHNEHRVVHHHGARLVVAGVPDPFGTTLSPHPKPDTAQAVEGADGDFTLLLAHRPTEASRGESARVDLQLSGHTHGGQYMPFTWLVSAAQPFPTGLTQLRDRWLFVSCGTAWWGPPMRWGARHEVTLLVLRAA